MSPPPTNTLTNHSNAFLMKQTDTVKNSKLKNVSWSVVSGTFTSLKPQCNFSLRWALKNRQMFLMVWIDKWVASRWFGWIQRMTPFLQYLEHFMSIKINGGRGQRAKGLMANLIQDTRNSTQGEFDLYSRAVGICLCIFCIIKIYLKSLRLRERLF